MNKTKFGIYDIETDYLKFLHERDKHVSFADYEDEGRQRKFYCGPVYTSETNINYYVPVSSKSIDTKQSDRGDIKQYCLAIENGDRDLGTLDFRHMIPCLDERINPRFINPQTNSFGYAQAKFCLSHEEEIKKYGEKMICDKKFDFSSKSILATTACELDDDVDFMLEYECMRENEEEKETDNTTTNTIENTTRLDDSIAFFSSTIPENNKKEDDNTVENEDDTILNNKI